MRARHGPTGSQRTASKLERPPRARPSREGRTRARSGRTTGAGGSRRAAAPRRRRPPPSAPDTRPPARRRKPSTSSCTSGARVSAQPGIRPVPLSVDPGTVHRHEEAGVRVLVADGGDHRAVEREVGRHVDVEERHRASRPRRPWAIRSPGRPAVVVAACREDDRLVPRPAIGPGACDLLGQLGMVGLEDDVPGVPGVADDHRRPRSPASTSSVVTTSPYFVSMS